MKEDYYGKTEPIKPVFRPAIFTEEDLRKAVNQALTALEGEIENNLKKFEYDEENQIDGLSHDYCLGYREGARFRTIRIKDLIKKAREK